MAVNRVHLIGNLGADPEMRQTQGGPVCNLRIATTEKWSDADGNKKERTEWHNVTVWGRQAENCGTYLAKGRQVYIEGRLQSREYQDKDGNNRKVWDVVAQSVQFLAGGNDSGGQQQDRPPAQSDGGWGQGGSKPEPAQSSGGGWGGQQSKPAASGGWGAQQGGPTKDDPIPF